MINAMLMDNQVKNLEIGNITFLESFQQETVFNEPTSKFWFEYKTEEEVYPFELSAKIGRNWLDENDKTPIIEMDFSTIMAKNGNFKSLGNDILKDRGRKAEIKSFYFKFENMLKECLNQQNIPYGFKRDNDYELFGDYQWFLEGKGVMPSGRIMKVKNLEFENSSLWSTEEQYKKETIFAENKQAKRYIRYFLGNNNCDKIVKEFLTHVLNSGKEVRITREASFWKYNFVIRPDMLTHDYKTLSKLGYILQYNFDNFDDRLAAMEFAFKVFSVHGVVNICLDEETLKNMRNEDEKAEKDPLSALLNLQQSIFNKVNENRNNKNSEFEKFAKTYDTFLDGLLDMHNKYQTLYKVWEDEKYKKRSERAKRLWLKYIS